MDLIEKHRVAKLLQRPQAESRLFSPAEIEFANNSGRKAEVLGGCFAAKEAVVKALGTGFVGITLKDIEVTHCGNGKPEIALYGSAKVKADELGVKNVQLSITHNESDILAMVMMEDMLVVTDVFDKPQVCGLNFDEIARPAWLKIDLGALRHNFKQIQNITPNTKIMAVVKANAYGHGDVKVAKTLLSEGAYGLAVATLAEGIMLRQAGVVAPILLLSFVDYNSMYQAIQYNLTQTVYTLEMAKTISETAAELGDDAKIHLAFDSGMGRIGFREGEESLKVAAEISKLPNIEIAGVFSHFASADETDKAYTQMQLAKFQKFVVDLENLGIKPEIIHTANSAAIMDMPETHCNMVRAGIIMYGCYPSEEVVKSKIDLKPVMSFKAKITCVKTIDAGDSVSYGRIFTADAPMKIATIPVGYADGFNRKHSNNGYVMVKGHKAQIVGRVCMDQFMVDVTGIDVAIGDEVLLWGKNGDDILPIEEVAEQIGSFNYELLTCLSARLPRLYK